ncbi:reverse transcriptase domain, reverse transcriptase zinc-binding domain protein [Tanacetum coccineum]
MVLCSVTLMVKEFRVANAANFSYHKGCFKLKIINICFADDLSLFSRGDIESAKFIMDALDEFKLFSSLVPTDYCPLYQYASSRIITHDGFFLSNIVSDVVGGGSWSWPQAWYVNAPIMNNCATLNLILDREDYMVWKDLNGNQQPFSTHVVWDVLRPSSNDVHWDAIVWFSNCIQRHAFLVWFIMNKRLNTQDMLRQWDLVWSMVRLKVAMDGISPNWEDSFNWIMLVSPKRSAISIIACLVLGATAYFI